MNKKDNSVSSKNPSGNVSSSDFEEFLKLIKRMPPEEKLKLYYIAQGIMLVLDKAITT